nr:DUF637 domain-containing protein [Providencia burhodogranariea]
MPNDIPSFPKRILGYGIMFITAIYPLHPAWSAGITPADKNTQITQQNNVPIINIATPNNIGVSHNKFQNFNVDKQGAVLNNAINNINSQLAGQVKANANLKVHAANLIINEVVGSGHSQLQGILEVAGKQANVLIANPNGITCNGCGFINTPAITLTTGKPIMDKQGALSAIEVKKGSVIVGGKGMDVQAQSYADIISRATELNGQIKAKNLMLVQGANRVDIQQGTVIPAKGEGQKPSISVDTKALGGMYADQVRLVSTENGVGVNLSNIQTTQNDLTLTVDGKITLAGNIQSKNEINISTKNLQISNNAKLSGQKDITLAANTLNNNGQVIAGKDMRVFADTISNSGDKALIQAKDNLWMQKNAKGDLSTLIENKSATIKTDTGDLVVRTKNLSNMTLTNPVSELVIPANSTSKNNVVASFFGSREGVVSIITLYPELEKFNYKKWFGTIDMEKGNQINVERKVYSLTKKLGEISSGKNIYVNANEFINDNGRIESQGDLILTGNNANLFHQGIGEINIWNKYHSSYQDLGVYADETEDTGTYDIFYVSEPLLFKLVDKYSSWNVYQNDIPFISAGKSLALDFKNKININRKSPITSLPIKKLHEIENKSYDIRAKNILLSSSDIYAVAKINALNELSLITSKDMNLNYSYLTGNENVSLLSNGDVKLNNVNVSGKNALIMSKNGGVNYTLNPPHIYKEGLLSGSAINVSDTINFNAGKNILINNIILSKFSKLNITANGNVKISREESRFLNESQLEKKDTVNQQIKKVGIWESLGDMSFSAGGSILSQGITFKSGQSLTFNAGQDINLASKAIKDVDTLFQTNRYPELRSQLIANGNITLNAARDIDLKSALLLSKNNTTILSGRDMKLTASLYSAIPDSHEDLQDTRYVTTSISGDKGLTLASNSTITSQGSSLKSLNDINISAGGNIRFESIKTHYRKQEGNELQDLYRQIGSNINSAKNLTIVSEGSILFQASRLAAKGMMDIAAKGGYLYAQAMEETSHYEEEEEKCNKWTLCITKNSVNKTYSERKNKVTEFTAGKDINLYAKDDVTLEATKINTGKNVKIISQTGKVNFKAVKNTTFEQIISNSKGFYITQRNKGYKDDKWVLPVLHIGGKLTVNAKKGITADVKAKNNQSLQNALNVLGETKGTKWLAGLKDRKDVQWNLVKDAYDSWDYKSQSLDPVASALIMIVVAAATSGSGLAAWAGEGAVSATGATGMTADVIAGAGYSGMTALTSQAAVALAENKGDLSKTLNTLGKSETVKTIITQMVISGALNGLDVKMGWTSGNPAAAKLPLLSNGDWTKVAQRVASHSVIGSTLNTTIQGGSFSDNFRNALLSNVANQINAEGAKLIGNNGEILGHTGKVLSHAVVSGISAEISGGDAKGAVVGALAAELAAITLDSNLFKPSYLNEKEKQIALMQNALSGNKAETQFTKVLGAFAGALVTHKPEGAFSAANSAELVFSYNYTDHMLTEIALENNKDMFAAAKGDKAAARRVEARQEAAALVGLVAGGGAVLVIGGELVVAATPELLATAQVALTSCKASFVYCVNKIGIGVADIVVPEAAISGAAIGGAGYKVIASSDEVAKALADSMIKSAKPLLAGGKLNTTSLTPIIEKEQRLIAANKKAIVANKLIPENFISKITAHNTQLGVLNAKKTGISGAHKQDAFLESVEIAGAKINLKTTDNSFPGLIEYKYQLPAIAGNGPSVGKVIGYKKVESKTTYDPAVLPDIKVTNMSNQAAKQAESYFQFNPSKGLYDVKVDGYWFRVTKDSKTGEISNAFITMPSRNSKW